MSISPLLNVLHTFEKYNRLCSAIEHNAAPLSVFGLGDAHKAHITAGLFNDLKKSILYVVPTEADCRRVEQLLTGFGAPVLRYPAKSLSVEADTYGIPGGTEITRMETLIALSSGEPCVVVACAEAVMQIVAPKDVLFSHAVKVAVGDTIDMTELIYTLADAGYVREETCAEKGQFAVRGGRIDVFAANSDSPVRIELFGDEVDTMRAFDADTQRSTDNVESALILPATETPATKQMRLNLADKLSRVRGDKDTELIEALRDETAVINYARLAPVLYDATASVTDYLPEGALIMFDEPPRFFESAETEFSMFASSVEHALETTPSATFLWDLMFSPRDAVSLLESTRTVMLFSFTQTFQHMRPKDIITFDTRPAQSYNLNYVQLISDLKDFENTDTSVVIYGGKKAASLLEKLEREGSSIAFSENLTRDFVKGERILLAESAPKGFDYYEYSFVCITESELMGQGTLQTRQTKSKKQEKAASTLIASELVPGDYVVHDVHGIARFTGIETITADHRTRDYIRLVFQDGQPLFVPADQLSRVSKYIGNEGDEPKLSRLGGTDWQKTVKKVSSGVKKLAIDLMKLYGERMTRPGFTYSPDTVWQHEFESDFPYVETPDQLSAIADIKRDMEGAKIMDRLLCGDVGFGKTEVAMRAAFKAIMDKKQVAFLVPTTVLAHQHYNTLVTRMGAHGVSVDYISRFKNKTEQKETLDRLASGKTDIIVGTHRLLSQDVKYLDLGLLIVDEEQRFGVGHKEKIKDMRKTVDVLTLTATPIPRTLHMSVIGMRDVSVLDTPPARRYPVATFVTEYSDAVAREAISREIGRNGQVFFLYNNVQRMPEFYEELCKLVPQARITYAHGQMSPTTLENTMLDFVNGEYDVLLCSTIIENGLDISNANTIIIYDADKLGLSQLYQLRGRVGRGTRVGYAYLTFQKNKVLNDIAGKRLTAISELTQLGSGHKLALRDLQIRGAGDLLGAEQHGRIAEVGYNLYSTLLENAISEAKGETPKLPKTQTAVEAVLDAFISREYISNDGARIQMYKRIAAISDTEDVYDVQDEFIDRFGDMPPQVLNLINVAHIKALASDCYINNVRVNSGEVTLTLEPGAPYNMDKLVDFVKNEGARFISQKSTQLYFKKPDLSVVKLCAWLPKPLSALRTCLEKQDS